MLRDTGATVREVKTSVRADTHFAMVNAKIL